MRAIPKATKAYEFWAGVRDTFPLVVGAIPFGIIYGALAVRSGLSTWASAGMSAIVFAGSSQFIAVGLIAGGAGPLVIVFTTFIVNLRHALYATTLGPHLRELSQRWLLPLGFWLTDETFLVSARRFNQADGSRNKHWYYLGSAVFMYTNWQLVTWVGILAGRSLPDAGNWGLDFAMIATFIGMLAPLIEDKATISAVAAAGLTGLAANGLPNQLGLLAAALVGILVGLLVEGNDNQENGE
jgi:4-azaleucine resistance transporter AzlC